MLFFNKKEDDTISVKDVDPLLGKIELIDIREPYEFTSTHIKGAKNIPMAELLHHPDDYMMADKKYYLICQSGNRSGRAMNLLRNQGYDVINVAGGMLGYKGENRL